MPQPINTADIPEIAYPDYLILDDPPEDQYKMMRMVDHWAANQAVADTDLKPHGLAWLALDEQARLEHCENYLGAVQDRAQHARED